MAKIEKRSPMKPDDDWQQRTCVWKIEYYENATESSHYFRIESLVDGYSECRSHTVPSLDLKSWIVVNFKYCPYCGREIEVKDE